LPRTMRMKARAHMKSMWEKAHEERMEQARKKGEFWREPRWLYSRAFSGSFGESRSRSNSTLEDVPKSHVKAQVEEARKKAERREEQKSSRVRESLARLPWLPAARSSYRISLRGDL